MKFGNPISEIKLAGPTSDASNSTSGSGTTTVTLLPAPPSGQRYYIGFINISLSDANGCSATIQETLTASDTIWSGTTPTTANNPINAQFQFNNYPLPIGAGLSMTLQAGGYVNTFKAQVFYYVGS